MWYQEDPRAEIKKGLWEEITSAKVKSAFARLKSDLPELAQFDSPEEFVRFMHSRNNRDYTTVPQSQWGGTAFKNRVFHALLTVYQTDPPHHPELLTLFLLVLWPVMDHITNRFFNPLQRHSIEPFSEVYWAYINALLKPSTGVPEHIIRIIKDRSVYLVKKELRQAERFQADIPSDTPAPDEYPGQTQIELMLEEWIMHNIVTWTEGELIIHHLIYEQSLKRLAREQGMAYETIKKRFQRALKKLKPYLRGKCFGES